jgi:hypothetical protein
MYFGVYEDETYYLLGDFTSRERLLKNKLCGEGQNIRSLTIQKLTLQIKVIENDQIKLMVTIVLYF